MVDFDRTQPIHRARRRAMIIIASVLIGWVLFDEVRMQWKSRASSVLNDPPRFFVDLETASEDELQLLPDIGEKTARAWRQALDERASSPPRFADDLQALPNVGPIRSSKLAPFLVESESRATSGLGPSKVSQRPSANP